MTDLISYLDKMVVSPEVYFGRKSMWGIFMFCLGFRAGRRTVTAEPDPADAFLELLNEAISEATRNRSAMSWADKLILQHQSDEVAFHAFTGIYDACRKLSDKIDD